jgi:O-antigen/teichoic acid export membrane protein
MAWKGIEKKLLELSKGKEAAALVDQALVSGANFFTTVILARGLGVGNFGVFTLAWAVVILVNNLQIACVVSPMMSIGPKQEAGERPCYFGAVLVQECGFALCVALVVLLVALALDAGFPRWNIHGLGLPLAFTTLAYLLQDFSRRYFFSTRRPKLALIADSISYLTQLPIILFIERRPHFTPAVALWVIGGTSLVSFIVCAIWFEPIQLNARFVQQVAVRHWRFSRWLAPSALIQWGSGSIFVLLAPVYYGAAAAGILRVAQNIVALAHVWFLGLDNVVPAEASRRMHREGVEECLKYILQITRRWGALTFAFLLVIAISPSFWLKVVYGTAYLQYGHVLQLFAAFYFIVFFGGPIRAGLQALEYTSPVFWSYLAMTVFSVALAGSFAKNLGLDGAVVGMIGGQIISQVILGISFARRIHQTRHAETLLYD